MISQGWRAAIAAVGAVAFCWGVAGAVHLGFDCHGNGRGATYCSLPEGGGPYELAMLVGFIVSVYSVPGILRRTAWWPSLSLSLGAGAGAVAVLALGQETRYWIAAALMGAVGSAAPLVNRLWGRHHPV
ncbi:hypothetical protein [Streptomyces sp. WAC01280]|uniref:hypothetical protein n=1 Tax=Streptomyces sp. WAC01280 TaxID=2487424 RepID=UPI000F76D2F9|nr:hypothetical protein [Streptomyces sp. WAC01280]RSS51488.1 hypothetical protein EF909_34995 [Streptomyces sp. WAC01280]